MLRTLLVVAAGLTAATVALAQGEPGAGAPAAPHGEPYAPNASVAPSAMPNGGAMGTQANTATNVGRPSADQSDRAQSAQPGLKPGHHTTGVSGTSGTYASPPVNGTSSTPSSSTTPP